MAENPERVISRIEIAERVWNTHFDTGTNFIDVYINYLRKKIDRIMREREIEFREKDYESIGMVYTFGGREYVVTAAAYDGYGTATLRELRQTLLILFIAGLSVLFVVGYLLSWISLRPIRSIVKEAESITAR